MNEHPHIVASILNNMRMNGKRYYTLKELTYIRHGIALDIMRNIDKEINHLGVDLKNYDPLSFFMSTAYTSTESVEEKYNQFNPILTIIKAIIDPKHEYFKYEHIETNKICHAFWKPIEDEKIYKQKLARGSYMPHTIQRYDNDFKQPPLNYNGKTVGNGLIHKEGEILQMDTFFLPVPDVKSKAYMAAVMPSKHVMKIYYSIKFWVKLVKGKKGFEPIHNNELLIIGGGYSGDPDTKKNVYVEKNEPFLFGINVQSDLFKSFYTGVSDDVSNPYNRRKIEFPHWTYESYTNILISILLMEHELHHALIDRYSYIMQYATDLLEQQDLDYNITEMWNMYMHYYKDNANNIFSKPYRKTKEIQNQYGAVKIDENSYWNAFSNTQGHNAFFCHLTYRSHLLGLAVTIDPQRNTQVLINDIMQVKNEEPQEHGGSLMTSNYTKKAYIEDIFNQKLNLKF